MIPRSDFGAVIHIPRLKLVPGKAGGGAALPGTNFSLGMVDFIPEIGARRCENTRLDFEDGNFCPVSN